MRELINWVAAIWNMYWDEGYYQYLMILSVLYLLFFIRRSAKASKTPGQTRQLNAARQLVAVTVLTLLVFFCPLTARIIRACIGSDVYWRVLWLLPLTPLLAFTGTLLIRLRSSRAAQFFAVVLTVVILAACGKDMIRAGRYVRLSNYQKVPDEVAAVCNLIQEQADEDHIQEIRLASDDSIASYVRVYDASILMPYGRWGKGALDKASEKLYRQLNKEQPNYLKIARLAIKKACSFLVIPDRGGDPASILSQYGYLAIGTAGSYTVFEQTDPSVFES